MISRTGEIPTLCDSVFTPFEVVAAWIITFLAAVLQGTLGFGFAILSVPLLTLLNPDFTPIPQLFLALPMTVAATWRERHHLDLDGVGWIIAGRVPGALLGAWVLTIVAERTLGAVIAVIVLLAVAAIALGLAIRLNPATRLAAGFTAGFTGTTSAIGGPPLALLYKDASGGTLRSSLGAIFTIGLLINISALFATKAIRGADFLAMGWLMVPMLAGFGLSGRLTHLIEGPRIKRGILVVSASAALALLVRTLTG